MSSLSLFELRTQLDELVQRSALYLDEERFGEFLDLTAQDFRYVVEAFSPELKKGMTWLEHDRAGLAALIELLPKHHRNGASWLRQVVLGPVIRSAGAAESVSSVTIFHTAFDIGDAHVEAGTTRLFAVGRYHDRFREERERWLLVERRVRIQTRELGVGSHQFP
ncbi:MAG: nuclear transport factor 2 family protein [Myxococcota bacterium]|nr:nuclear transport factor 2 family protein [Myxococcota bacterium]